MSLLSVADTSNRLSRIILPTTICIIVIVTFDFSANGKVTVHSDHTEDWRVTVVDTGLNTMTGGRLKRLKDYISGEPFSYDLR